MFLASLFLAAFARALASPIPATAPGSAIPSPVCIVAAAVTASRCDPTKTRTIFDILYSCIGVILLCTYISIHHNIPDQNDSQTKVMWLKLRTTLYALVAPEVVIVWAIRQRIMATRIEKENRHRGWTSTHGFFVQMGGLIQRVGHDSEQNVYRVVGVTGGENGRIDWKRLKIPRIPEKEIKDHGKGDILAKALVVVQTTWFVAQCIARHVQGLILTEIELVTLAFATLNVITYALWWDKPLNIGYPIYFDGNGNRIDGPGGGDGEDNDQDGELPVKEWEGAWHERVWSGIKSHAEGWGDVCRDIWEDMKQSWGKFSRKHGIWVVFTAPFVVIFGPVLDMMSDESIENRPTSVHPFYAASMSENDKFLAGFYGAVIGVIFGAIHLVGWNFGFPTTAEIWLWRAASLILAIVPLNLAIAFASLLAQNGGDNDILMYIGVALAGPTIFLGPPIYFSARIILLFLAFFTLRALPDAAYQNVRWTEFLPHI